MLYKRDYGRIVRELIKQIMAFHTKSSRTFILISVFLLAAIGAVAYYFVALRPPDSDYQSAQKQVTAMTSIASTINRNVSTITTPVQINNTVVSIIKEASSAFSTQSRELSKQAIVSRDAQVKKAYTDSKVTIDDYSATVTELATSLDAYMAIVDTCSRLVENIDAIQSSEQFDVVSADCETAITNGETSPKGDFYEQFLKEYVANANDLLSVYDQLASTRNSNSSQNSIKKKITDINKKIASSRDINLELSMGDTASTQLKGIASVLQSQQRALFR